MLCEDCKKKVNACERHCPHTMPSIKDPDVIITLSFDRFTVVVNRKLLLEEHIEIDSRETYFTTASVMYNAFATLTNVVEVHDITTGLKIVRDRKIDMKTIKRQLQSAFVVHRHNNRK